MEIKINKCIDCEKDISHRRLDAKRCKKCERKNYLNYLKNYRKTHKKEIKEYQKIYYSKEENKRKK